ncbi:MAG: cytochrome c oxidase subunit II [Xenococcaceae cyanobacterium MO_234.B1]|nr:cytochrome c oxidase subunit II [Xenococcaceae cyanobacterium MO_234.B1]
MNIPSNIITLIAGIALTLISLWYGQNHGLLPIAASEEAAEIDGLFNFMMTIATGLFLLVEGVLVYSVIRFRRRKGDTTDGPPVEGNVPLEIVWTAIPTIIVFILAVYSFDVYNTMGGLDPMASHDYLASHDHHQMVATEEDNSHLVAMDGEQVALGLGQSPYNEAGNSLVVNVNGIQYAWIFTYPDTGIVSGELHVPVNRPVQLNMTAGDVLHAFWLPEFRIKQDVIPGRESELSFTPTKVGQYPVICAELCGAYHGGMKTTLTVHSAEDYQQWLQDNTIAQTEVDGNVALGQ